MKNYSLLMLPLLAVLAWGCKKEKEPENPIEIGKFYQGGYIFYIDASGQHGMVMAGPEIEQNLQWGCPNIRFNLETPQSKAFGRGNANTQLIVSFCNTQNIATRFCYELVYAGYDDWFLPNSNECDSAFEKLQPIPQVKIQNTWYWSSNEYSGVGMAKQYPNQSAGTPKTSLDLVRPVRNF